jgi:hypothetical protein
MKLFLDVHTLVSTMVLESAAHESLRIVTVADLRQIMLDLGYWQT